MTFTIVVEPWVNPGIADQVTGLIAKWAHIVPPTFNEIKVSYDSSIECPCEIRCHDEYRKATIVVGPQWPEITTENPERIIVHELSHLYTIPICRRAKEAFDMIAEPNSAGNKMAYDSVTKAWEACTEDLAQTFLRQGLR